MQYSDATSRSLRFTQLLLVFTAVMAAATSGCQTKPPYHVRTSLGEESWAWAKGVHVLAVEPSPSPTAARFPTAIPRESGGYRSELGRPRVPVARVLTTGSFEDSVASAS